MRSLLLALIATSAVAQSLPTIHVFPTSAGGQIGQAVCMLGDMSSDGVPEIATTHRFLSTVCPLPFCSSCCFQTQTSGLRVFSGQTGALLFTHDDPLVNGTTDSVQIADAGDLDFDGKPDIAWSLGINLRVMSSQNAAVLRQWTFSGSAYSFIAVVGLSDVDGDGVRDLAVGEPYVTAINAGRVTIFSGTTGAVVRTLNDPSPGFNYFGKAIVGVDDLDGDAITDVVVGAPYSPNGGRCVAFSGATGNPLWTATSTMTSLYMGTSLALAGDVNADGVPDVIAGAPGGGFPNAGRAMWPSGASGTVLLTAPGSGAVQFGTVVGGGFDVNGDGVADVAIGDPATNNAVSLFDSTGTLLETYTQGPGYGYTAMVAPDLNGDGYGELVTSNLIAFGQLRVDAFLGAQRYATAVGPMTLAWVTGGGIPASGQLALAGASSLAAGALGASLSALSPTGSPPIVISLSNLIYLSTITFDATGGHAIPLDLRQPSLSGASVFVQAAEFGPSGVTTSNGLQLLFGH